MTCLMVAESAEVEEGLEAEEEELGQVDITASLICQCFDGSDPDGWVLRGERFFAFYDRENGGGGGCHGGGRLVVVSMGEKMLAFSFMGKLEKLRVDPIPAT